MVREAHRHITEFDLLPCGIITFKGGTEAVVTLRHHGLGHFCREWYSHGYKVAYIIDGPANGEILP